MEAVNFKRLSIWLASPILASLVIVLVYHLAKNYRFDSDAPLANYPTPSSLAEARAQDVEHLALFFEHERSWTPATFALAKASYKRLRSVAASMSDAEFDLGVALVVAAANNGHTKIREYGRTPRYNRLPIRGHVFGDGYFIIRAHEGYESLLGKQVVAIDGHSMKKLRADLRQYVGGEKGMFDKYLPYLLESPQLLHAAGLSSSPDSVSIEFIDAENRSEYAVFDAPFPSSSEQIARSYHLLAPQIYAESQPQWKSLHSTEEDMPRYLRAPFEEFQFVQNERLGISYLQFWSNNDSRDKSIKAFCEESLDSFRENPTQTLVIDQRFNGGGNYQKTSACMTAFGESVQPDGRLYVVIGGPTFSAGIVSAAYAMAAGGDRAMLIGTPVGDGLVSWSEDNLLTLPNSGIEIKFSTGKHDLQNGCDDWRDCHWGGLFSDLRINSMTPDIEVHLTLDDYLNRRDPIMDAIEELSGNR